MAKQKKAQEVSAVRQAKHGWIITLLFAVLSILWISPIFMVLLNSFKRKAYIFKHPFGISTVSITEGFEAFKDGMSRLFCSTLNYKNGLRMTHFWDCFGNSLFITVGSVVLIVLCCSMCAWYIVRVKTKGTKLMYTLCLFSMIVPFQMVMFTLSKFANMLHLSNPLGIIIVYLGFGAGLAVFMFTGFVKSISLEIEEAAMIDGCTPLQMYFRVVFPILRPTAVTVAILEAMWVWNDYLLPSLVLGRKELYTLPIATQAFYGTYSTDLGLVMAALLLAMLPILVLYLFLQRYIVEGVTSGAVKG